MAEHLDVDAAEAVLKEIVHGLWNQRLSILKVPLSERDRILYSAMWHVVIPGTGLNEASALDKDKAPADEFGFEVWLDIDGTVWEFRHPSNHWERWAQDKVTHILAKRYGTHIQDDGVGRMEADPEALKDSFTLFVGRNFPEPRSDSTKKWIARHLAQAPAGFE